MVKSMEKEKKGLVLEGGGLRGIFSAGVLDVFLENGISFDGVVGVSAGACFGCNLISGQVGRAIRYNVKYCRDKRYCSISSLIKTGDLFNADFCYRQLPFELDPFDYEAFVKNPTQFWVVATDVKTGKPVYHKCTDCKDEDMEWIRASASLPIVANIVDINGGEYLDGGISDSIPLRFIQKEGYKKNVVILTQPLYYQKKKNLAMPLIRQMYSDYPELIRAMGRRHVMYNKETRYVRVSEKKGETLVIRPPFEVNVGKIEHDKNKIEAGYRMGVMAGREALSEVRKFLAD